MKIISIVLLAAFVTTGCGNGGGQSSMTNSSAQSSAKASTLNNHPQILKANGDSAEQTVLGVSTNSYGVWDDVEQYIESRFKDPKKAQAMRQYALAVQNALLQGDTPEKAQEANRVRMRAGACVSERLGEADWYESKLLTAEILNDEARSRAYAILDSNSAGFYKLPKGQVCDN
jgi:hypothetical protein